MVPPSHRTIAAFAVIGGGMAILFAAYGILSLAAVYGLATAAGIAGEVAALRRAKGTRRG